MRKRLYGLVFMTALAGADALTAAHATGTRLPQGPSMMPQVTLLSREFRWQWDPFRVQGEDAYAVALITNNHQYALTLKTYCKNADRLMRPLSGRHLIPPGETLRWDTRVLVRKTAEKVNAVVTCKFWVDGSIDLRGQIVNSMPVRMGGAEMPWSLVTFNFENFPAGRKG